MKIMSCCGQRRGNQAADPEAAMQERGGFVAWILFHALAVLCFVALPSRLGKCRYKTVNLLKLNKQ